jgi:hypothetical protein
MTMANQRERSARPTVPEIVTQRLVSDDAVRARAYELFEARGAEHGHDVDDWLQAKQELQYSDDRDVDWRG